jgi:hypothetical protein
MVGIAHRLTTITHAGIRMTQSIILIARGIIRILEKYFRSRRANWGCGGLFEQWTRHVDAAARHSRTVVFPLRMLV